MRTLGAHGADARAVISSAHSSRIEAIIREVPTRRRDTVNIANDVLEMRQRLPTRRAMPISGT